MIGFNPALEGSWPSQDMNALREQYRSNRFYVPKAKPGFEDGYHPASLENLAVGMPAIGNSHPSAPIQNSVNGYIDSEPEKMIQHIQEMLDDPGLARQMGEAARSYVLRHLSFKSFNDNWLNAIAEALHHFQNN